MDKTPTLLQVEAANAYSLMTSFGSRLYISEQTASILRLRPQVFAAAILGGAQPLQKGAYLRRWARRLRNFSFSAEDAIIVAYGSFGTDPDRGSVGVDLIVTTDKKLATRYGEGYVDIEKRFNNMIWNLPVPYSTAKLPRLIDTATLLTLG